MGAVLTATGYGTVVGIPLMGAGLAHFGAAYAEYSKTGDWNAASNNAGISFSTTIKTDFGYNNEDKPNGISQNAPVVSPKTVDNEKDDSIYATTVPFAITAASIDGPIPIGDAIGAIVLAGATAYDATQRTFVTYTMTNSFGQTYVGRTSGYADPYTIMMNRVSGHHMNEFGFGNPVLDKAVQGYQGYPAIRGREQQLIDFYGGIGDPGVGNRIRGVSPYNPAGQLYHEASNLYFGSIAPFTGFKYF